MQFKHPELLYALFLLLIPVIVHLFQLRRFQKVPFTNVEFLKSVTMQTRKSSQLKKWLILTTRLLLLAAAILAFAQPYTSEVKGLNKETETVIYLDNSFSMQAKGTQGELLKRAVQDIIGNFDETETFTLYTNSHTFRNVTPKAIRNDLLQLEYTGDQLDYDAALLKGKNLFANANAALRNLVLISDFQQKSRPLNIQQDSTVRVNLVQLKPQDMANVSIDSAYVSNSTISNFELNVVVNQQGNSVETLPVSLYDGDNLIAKASITESDRTASFTLPGNQKINGRIYVDDANLQFDNTLYFNINERPKINVLSINSADGSFLQRIFTDDEFNFTAVADNQLNFNDIEKQNLIILNELESLPTALINALRTYVSNNGYVLIIPSENSTLTSYNQLLNNLSSLTIQTAETSEHLVTTINYSHPVFNDVFDKQITNFQYPKVNSYFNILTNTSPMLQFEDGKPFLVQSNNIYVFASALNTENSNFINSPLIVPTLYNIGRKSFQVPKLYYTIGMDNTFDINTNLEQDDILKLRSNDAEVIPQQRTYKNKVVITTGENPDIAGIYSVNDKAGTLEHVSFNYNRSESNLSYMNIGNIDNALYSDSVPQVIDSLKSAANINALWKWFAIFALVFLVIEMLILKFFK